ncbi:TetR/AcrR family transcriptional regulator [Cognatishimia activa]|uniref:TetR/AcrR family transcriptional regulator n=1 Tax=Cognatishimia activa TaxID=1715691 RepID=UPI00222E5DB0|nr:TetR/AcrR family transcriptional regulator [Cognatishimia activa]UZD91395.1 TetR/AcrR family transcriptional regulator [Cognatishimia activa]
MRKQKKQERHAAIVEAAYALLSEKGYAGASMLNIAKAAKASNETLYRWYGDKTGLFEAMVRDNASETEVLLRAALKGDENPLQALQKISPIFLEMLLGERAILLNRAAASDPTGILGEAISKGGRDVIQPLFLGLIQATGKVSEEQLGAMTRTFVHLLIGDHQIKRVIGVMPPPRSDEVKAQCALALEQFEIVLEAQSSA